MLWCNYEESCYTGCHYGACPHAECHHAKWSDECHYAQCHSVECCGAFGKASKLVGKPFLNHQVKDLHFTSFNKNQFQLKKCW